MCDVNERDENVKLYGVSTGNGNNGVSHMFPDYYVWTDQPYRLAKAALVDTFNKGEGMAWALENVTIDGEAEYTIYATIYDPPEDDADERHFDPDETGESWSDANGAWLILEVFPVEESECREGKMIYNSISDALTETVLKLVPEDN